MKLEMAGDLDVFEKTWLLVNEDKKVDLRSYINVLTKKRSELKQLPAAVTILRKLEVLVKSSQDLDQTFLQLLSYMQMDHFEVTIDVNNGRSYYLDAVKIITQIAENMEMIKHDFNEAIMDYEYKRFYASEPVFESLPKWNGSFNWQLSDRLLSEYNVGLTDALQRIIDHDINVIRMVKHCAAGYQKQMIDLFEITEILTKLKSAVDSKHTNGDDEEQLASELLEKTKEMSRKVKECQGCREFPKNLDSDLYELGKIFHNAMDSVRRLIDPTLVIADLNKNEFILLSKENAAN